VEASRDTGRARTLTGFAALGLFWGSWGAALPAVQSHANASDAALGAALFCVGAGALVAMRPAGVAVDRMGREVLPGIAALFAVSGFLPALVTSPGALAAVLLLLGATSGSLDVAINAEGVRTEEASGRPVLRLAHGIFSVGAVAGSLGTAGLRALGAGPAPALGTFCALVLLCSLITAVQAPAPPGHEEPAGLRELLRAPRPLLALGGLCALAFFVEGAWQSWSAVHLEDNLDASAGVASVAPALLAAAMAAGRLGGQRLKMRERRLLGAAALLAAAGSALAALAGGIGAALVGVAIAGLGISVCAPVLIAIGGRGATANRRGSAVSVVTTVAYLGFLLGPALVGVAADATSLTAALAGVAGVALVLAALARSAPGAS
jgi:predicted MFS family arabinose efflux permease